MEPVLFDIPAQTKYKIKSLYEAEKEFEKLSREKNFNNVFLVENTNTKNYFVSIVFKRSTVESYKNLKIIKSNDTLN